MNAEKSPVAHNVDHEEIAKFEAVASRWWDLEGEFKPLHRINPLRLGYIAERSGVLFGRKCRRGWRHPGGKHGARRGDGHRPGYGL
jgi:2-polyprenyl-3-methyl-5-hydroxy-6-metoxy-1,4-benzoquinol methylase